jgi:hypothetical protein
LIVIISGPRASNIEKDVQSLRSEVIELKKAVQTQTNEIKRLNEKVGNAQQVEKNPARP